MAHLAIAHRSFRQPDVKTAGANQHVGVLGQQLVGLVLVPAGSRVLGGGLCLFGSRRVVVRPGYGPDLRVLAVSIFGGLTIAEAAHDRPGVEPYGRRALPF